MTKYVRVKERPIDIAKDEYVITMPNYTEDIKTCKTRVSPDRLLGEHYVRALAQHIANKYDPDFDAYKNLVVNCYRGVPVKDIAAINAFAIKMFNDQYPKMQDKYIDYMIKKRPFGTKLIYFVGHHQATTFFTVNGIDEIDPKDVDAYLERKPKKTLEKIFKPADTKKTENAV